jgi:hypothetical protein
MKILQMMASRQGFRVLGLALAAALSLMPITACSGNSAGSMTCSSYRALDTSDRLSAVKAMIDQRKGNDSPAAVDVAELSVDAYCFTHSSGDQISGVYGG